MKKTILKKIIKNIIANRLEILGEYVEIFTDLKYGEYYLRGQLLPVGDAIYGYGGRYKEPEIGAQYAFIIFVLANEKYQKRIEKLAYERDFNFGSFTGLTLDELV